MVSGWILEIVSTLEVPSSKTITQTLTIRTLPHLSRMIPLPLEGDSLSGSQVNRKEA